MWTGRLLLESQLHDQSVFLTLTYDDDHVPENFSLVVRDYQLFLKRFRKGISPRRVSYYLVGEYGGQTKRPHYHVVLFGFGDVRQGVIRGEERWFTEDEKLLLAAWKNGAIHVASVTEASLAYACKHLTKGLNNGSERLDGRHPEFARMSLRPAIGSRALEGLSDWLTSKEGVLEIYRNFGDVPGEFRCEGKTWPLGRYLKMKLRLDSGLSVAAPKKQRDEMLREADERFARLGRKGISDRRRADLARAEFFNGLSHRRSKL